MQTFFLVLIALQDSDWKKENFAGAVPQESLSSKNGRIELANILGSRRWRHAGTA